MKLTIHAMAALLVAALAACSGDDDQLVAFEGSPLEKEYTLSVETAKGIGAVVGDLQSQTRALTQSGSTLAASWATTDRVYVQKSGTWATGSLQPQYAGATATLKGSLTGVTINADDVLTLQFPKSGTPDYSGQKGTLADIAANYDYATATATVRAVSGGNVAADAATFTNQQAIVRFTLLDAADGTTPINATSLTVSDGTNTYTVNPDAATNELYVAMPGFSGRTVTLKATTDLSFYKFEKTSVTFTNGQYYEVTVKMEEERPNIGDLYYSDGTWSETLEAGKTPIGVIAYLGTDNFTEPSFGGGHGLVLCLKNAASGVAWSTEKVSKFSGQEVTDVTGLKRTDNVSGYTNTATLTADEETAAKYPAAAAAKNYTPAAPASTTGWFLPSAQQWVKMIEGLGGLADGAPNFTESWFDNDHTAVNNWEAALAKAGDGNYDSMIPYRWYLSSSELSYYFAVRLIVDATGTGSYGFIWSYVDKGSTNSYLRVRPVLAF